VLIVSSHLGNKTGIVLYFVGNFADHQFTPTYEGVLDYSYLYAPLSLEDDQGRRLLWGWLREGRTVDSQKAAGWSGVQSIPRELMLRDGMLHMVPVPELESIRGTHYHFDALNLVSEMPVKVSGSALDFQVTFEGDLLGIKLACAPDEGEQTQVIYDHNRHELRVDREKSSNQDGVDTAPEIAAHTLDADEPLELRILLDGSVLEIIANGRTSLTSRIYPSRVESQGVHLFGTGNVLSMDIWEMNSIWP
jgi:beta-fructofuranosidase